MAPTLLISAAQAFETEPLSIIVTYMKATFIAAELLASAAIGVGAIGAHEMHESREAQQALMLIDNCENISTIYGNAEQMRRICYDEWRDTSQYDALSAVVGGPIDTQPELQKYNPALLEEANFDWTKPITAGPPAGLALGGIGLLVLRRRSHKQPVETAE